MGEDRSAPALAEARVVIIGLGLMGGSLALALRRRCRSLVGVSRRQETVDAAAARGMVDEATMDARQAIPGADVVVLAAPVLAIIDLLHDIGPALEPGCLVMDLGSTKQQIVAAMEGLPPGVQAIGGHPMCGKEIAGLDAAAGDLYRGRTFVLCPTSRDPGSALARAEELVLAIGARPLVLEPARHDRLVAIISHVPYLLSGALVSIAAACDDPALPALAANGFRDTSRLAGSDVTMMRDILLTNRDAVLEALADCQAWLADVRQLIELGDGDVIEELLAEIQGQHRRLRPWM